MAFAIARVAGWLATGRSSSGANRISGPPSIYYPAVPAELGAHWMLRNAAVAVNLHARGIRLRFS